MMQRFRVKLVPIVMSDAEMTVYMYADNENVLYKNFFELLTPYQEKRIRKELQCEPNEVMIVMDEHL